MYNLIPYVSIAFEIFNWLIVTRVFLSWIPHDPHKPIFRFLYEITDPILAPFRRLIGTRTSIDFSPVIAIIVLWIAKNAIIRLLLSL